MGMSGTSYLITVASNPGVRGWGLPSLGSISPNNLLRGVAMQALNCPPDSSYSRDFQLVVPSVVLPRDYFKYLLVQPGIGISGGLRWYSAAAASFSTGGGAYSQWVWGTGSDIPWGPATDGQVRTVSFQW